MIWNSPHETKIDIVERIFGDKRKQSYCSMNFIFNIVYAEVKNIFTSK